MTKTQKHVSDLMLEPRLAVVLARCDGSTSPASSHLVFLVTGVYSGKILAFKVFAFSSYEQNKRYLYNTQRNPSSLLLGLLQTAIQ